MDHKHCWHTPAFSITLASYPPQHEEICCHCGDRRLVSATVGDVPPGHGPYVPQMWGSGNLTVNDPF